jgi:hypothetical protein
MPASLRLRILRGGGIALVALGIVHLVATPHIATLIRRSTAAATAEWLVPPMLLNHVLVGALLIPLGYLAIYAGPHFVRGEPWAQTVVHTVSIAAAILPIALFSLMGRAYFMDAPLFVVGAALVVVAVLALLMAAFSR